MNRREFLATAGGATAVSIASSMHLQPAEAAGTVPLVVRGLVMASFEDPQTLRIGFVKAPGHNATLTIQPHTGSRKTMELKGSGQVEAEALVGKPRMAIPELILMKELYGNGVRSKMAACPNVLSIPMSIIQSITAADISPNRYTFVRADTGQEVTSFRPRQIAESIRIELSSAGTLRMGKTAIALAAAREIRAEVSPDEQTIAATTGDAFADHFHHYMMFTERPKTATYNVVPRQLSGGPSATSAKGQNFAFPPWYMCFAVGF